MGLVHALHLLLAPDVEDEGAPAPAPTPAPADAASSGGPGGGAFGEQASGALRREVESEASTQRERVAERAERAAERAADQARADAERAADEARANTERLERGAERAAEVTQRNSERVQAELASQASQAAPDPYTPTYPRNTSTEAQQAAIAAGVPAGPGGIVPYNAPGVRVGGNPKAPIKRKP